MDVPSTSRRGRWRKVKAWHLAIGIVSLCGFGGWATSAYTKYRAHRDVDNALARLKALGQPTDFDQIRRNVPDESNAFIAYRQALKLSLQMPMSKGPQIFPSKSTEDDYRNLAVDVAQAKSLMALLDKAVVMPDCEFPLEIPDSNTGHPLEDYYGVEMLTLPLQLFYLNSARLQSHKGAYMNALADASKATRMTHHASQPSIVGFYTHIDGEMAVLRELDKEILEWGDRADFRAGARKLLSEQPPMPTATSALATAAPSAIHLLLRAPKPEAKDEDQPRSFSLSQFAARFEAIRLAALAKSLNQLADAVETMKKDPADWKLAERTMSTLYDNRLNDNSPTGMMVRMASAPCFGMGSSIGRLLACINLSQTAIDIYEIKSRTGTFPTALPSNLRANCDPFTGTPFKYQRDGESFRLYSLGPNQVDDGGGFRRGHYTDDIEFAWYWKKKTVSNK